MTHTKVKKAIEFNVQLTANHQSNFQNVHLCFQMKIKLVAGNNNYIAAVVITVINFFAHLINEIDIKRYRDDIPILPLANTVNMTF